MMVGGENRIENALSPSASKNQILINIDLIQVKMFDKGMVQTAHLKNRGLT
jgi:hypothetical protein